MFGKGGPAQRVKAAMLLLGCSLVLASMIAQLSVWPVHSVQRKAIRHAMKDRILAGLPDSALTKFRFTPAGYERIEFLDGGRELRSEGVMYDIVRTYRDGEGMIVIEAARDDKETKLMADLGRMVQRRLNADEQGQQQRQTMVSSWAPFCGALQLTEVPSPPVAERNFPTAMIGLGRTAAAIDPGPPRSA